MAREKSDEVKQLYERFGDQLSVYPQFSQFTVKDDPRIHRVVHLTYRVGKRDLSYPRPQVDLTTREVETPAPSSPSPSPSRAGARHERSRRRSDRVQSEPIVTRGSSHALAAVRTGAIIVLLLAVALVPPSTARRSGSSARLWSIPPRRK